jgi:hypothetical protein
MNLLDEDDEDDDEDSVRREGKRVIRPHRFWGKCSPGLVAIWVPGELPT